MTLLSRDALSHADLSRADILWFRYDRKKCQCACITSRINYSTRYHVRDNTMKPVSRFARITTCIFVTVTIFSPLGKSGCDFHAMHRRRIDDRRKWMGSIGGWNPGKSIGRRSSRWSDDSPARKHGDKGMEKSVHTDGPSFHSTSLLLFFIFLFPLLCILIPGYARRIVSLWIVAFRNRYDCFRLTHSLALRPINISRTRFRVGCATRASV